MLRNLRLVVILLLFTSEVFSQCNANAGPNVTSCAGGPESLGAVTPASGTGPFSYSWAPAAGLSCTTCPNPDFIGSVNTTYTLTITDALGCTDNDNVNVTVTPSPTAGFTFTPNNSCANIPVNFTNTSTGTGLTYNWNFGNPASGSSNTSTATNPVHTFLTAGSGTTNFTVTLTVTNAAGCTATATQTVTVLESPDSELLDPLTNFKNCDGSTFNLQVFDNTVPASNSSYVIDWGDGSADFTAGAGTFPGGTTTHTYTTQGIFTITYTVTGTNGCINTSTYLASNITNPAIGAANPGGTTGCGPLTLCFPLSSFGGNHVSTTYRVDYGDGTPNSYFTHPPPATVCHTYTTSSCPSAGAAYTFSITAKNNCDSTTATVTPIRVYTTPEAHFTAAPNPVCTGSAVTFTNTSIAGFNSSCSSSTIYTWTWGDASAPTTVFTNAPQTHTYAAPGNYTVTLQASNSCGPSSESQVICVENPPVPSFTVTPSNGCVPLNVATTNTTTTLNTCNVTYNWIVTFNGSVCLPSSGSFSFTGGTNASSLNPGFVFNDPGNYTITLQVTNSCGTFTATQNIDAITVPQITMTPIANICAGNTVTPAATFVDCGNPITSYAWTFPGGTPATFSGATPGTVSYSGAGSPTISVTATNSCGSVSGNTSFTVSSAPAAPVVPATITVCENDTIELTASTIAGATYSWTGPGGFTSSLQNPILLNSTLANAGTYSVSASVGGCNGPVANTSVTVVPSPVVSVVPAAPSICAGGSVTLTANGASTYAWSPSAGLSASTGATVTASPATTTTYTVTGTGASCSNFALVTVTVNALPIVDAGPDQTACNQPTPINLTGTPAGGVWTGSGVTAGGVFTPSVNGSFNLTYAFTDANGCSANDVMVMTVINPTPSDAGVDFDICENAPAVNLTGTPAGGTWSGTNVTAGGLFTPASAGTFTLTYSTGAGSCLTTDDVDVTVNALPAANAGADQTVCIDAAAFNLTGTPAGGTWSGTGITNAAAGTFDAITAGLGTHTITYTTTNVATGCSNTDNINITVNALPVVSAGPDSTICDQAISVTLAGSPAGGTWSGPGISAAGVYTPSGTGIFTFTYTFTLGSGCTASDSRDITVIAPTFANAGADMSICYNAPAVSIAGLPAGGTWIGTGITGAGLFTPASVGTFTLTYSIGAGNCLTTDNMLMTVNPLPVVNAGPDNSMCVDAGTINFIGAPAGGTWSGTGITAGGLFDPLISGAGSFNLTYSFTNAATGCTNTDFLVATVNPLPIPSFTHNPTGCVGVPLSFTNTSTGAIAYGWSFGDLGTSGLTNPTHTYADTGTFTINLLAISAAGCDDQLTSTVTIFESPTANFTIAPDTGCGPLLVNITDLSGGVAISYNWDFGNGNSSTAASPAPQTYNPGILGDTLYFITLNVTNMCATVTHIDTVRVKPIPTAVFGPNVDIGCSPLTLTFANNSVGNPDTFVWDFGDGTTDTTSAALFTHTFSTGANDTTYTISLIVTNECGSDTSYHTITVLPNTVNAFFNTNVLSGCVPLTVNFTQFTTGATFSSWDFGDGNVSTVTSPTHTFTAAGTYTVTLYANDGCSFDTAYQTITVNPAPTVDFTTLPDSVCANQQISFINLSAGLAGISWDFGDGGTSLLTNPLHTYAATGVYMVTLTGTSVVTGCTGSITKPVNVNITPVSAFTLTPLSGCEPVNVNFTNASTNAQFYSWNFGDGNTSIGTNPSHTYVNDGTYVIELIAQNINGCADTTTSIVTVFPKPVSSFTVNPGSSCYLPANVQMNNTSVGASGFAWNFGNSTSSVLNNPVATYSATGTYTISLIATNLFGCRDTSTLVHTVYP
ncbi:MAG TPA: PKD domain-containing protein, partial [Flavobacteriales bacterium]|nr:PKD domain-containing protein [Flavobacteriales bacterium]